MPAVSTSSPCWILLFALVAAAMLDTALAKTPAGSSSSSSSSRTLATMVNQTNGIGSGTFFSDQKKDAVWFVEACHVAPSGTVANIPLQHSRSFAPEDTGAVDSASSNGTPLRLDGNCSICALTCGNSPGGSSNTHDLLLVQSNATVTGSTSPRDEVRVQCSIVDEAQTGSGKTAAQALGSLDGAWAWGKQKTKYMSYLSTKGQSLNESTFKLLDLPWVALPGMEHVHGVHVIAPCSYIV